MKAFIETLCEHCAIVRTGPLSARYGDPYDYAVVYLIENGRAHVKALTADGKFSRAHHKSIVAALLERGLRPKWQRIKKAFKRDSA